MLLWGVLLSFGVPVAYAQEDQVPDFFHLEDFWQVYQTWNNCGPATLTMSLNYWGWRGDQAVAARYLKPDEEDKNVSPAQMVTFVNDQVPGLRAIYRYGGDIALLKRLIFAGFPVVIETGFDPADLDWMGHYRLLVGYDDFQQSFYIFDSYLGSANGMGILGRYEEIDTVWQHFNRVYVVVYSAERESQLAEVLGEAWDRSLNRQRVYEAALADVEQQPDNHYAWFNLGTALVALERYEEAAFAYDEARRVGLPWRMLWYQFGPFEAYLHTAGRLRDVEALAWSTLKRTPYVEELYYYLGMAHFARGEYTEAIAAFEQAITFNPNFTPAYEARRQVRWESAFIF